MQKMPLAFLLFRFNFWLNHRLIERKRDILAIQIHFHLFSLKICNLFDHFKHLGTISNICYNIFIYEFTFKQFIKAIKSHKVLQLYYKFSKHRNKMMKEDRLSNRARNQKIYIIYTLISTLCVNSRALKRNSSFWKTNVYCVFFSCLKKKSRVNFKFQTFHSFNI